MTASSTSSGVVDYEQTYVHSVYDQIAPHFSSTRYKPWPLVSSFLLSLSPGSVGLDVGCGNGKYLAVNPSLFILGSDRSPALVSIASSIHVTSPTQSQSPHPTNDVLVADTLNLPHPKHRFDFATCIAVVHHLSTRDRRVAAIKAILETLNSPLPDSAQRTGTGKALIYVWALEQKHSRRGWDEGGEQDVMVPWVMKNAKETNRNVSEQHGEDGEPQNEEAGPQTFHRYYHLYRRGELEEDVETAGGMVLDSGYERDNWWAIASPVRKLTQIK